MIFLSYLNAAAAILKLYKGNEPFHLFIKKYFSFNKKHGSRDRKQITSLCYNFFRLGHSFKNIIVEEKILIATFLIERTPSAFLESLKPGWNALSKKPLKEKLSTLSAQEGILNIFPFQDELSKGIDAEKFSASFLTQPDVFLRIRPGNNKRVTGKLSGANITYKKVTDNCLAISNTSKLDDVIALDKEAVVQDLNSQRVGELIKLKTTNHKLLTKVWDCCAASGGKSIMAYDINPKIDLTVSDIRESILENLKTRFANAGITKYNSFVADLTTNYKQQTTNFDLIICDAPCTGSGTWSRTPEQLFYFKKESIEKYAILQKTILQNVVKNLKPGGSLLYITCSVFKKENEEIVKYGQEELKLQLERSEMFKGYEMKADTLFAAIFTAPLV